MKKTYFYCRNNHMRVILSQCEKIAHISKEKFQKVKQWYSSLLILDDDYDNIKMDWFGLISERLRDYSDGEMWSDGDEILCRTEDVANALADMFEQMYQSSGNDVVINTGYYNPEEDKRSGETDRYTGWWYVNIG